MRRGAQKNQEFSLRITNLTATSATTGEKCFEGLEAIVATFHYTEKTPSVDVLEHRWVIKQHEY